MTYYLFLDDERNPDLQGLDPSAFRGTRIAPGIECVVARDHAQFCQAIDERGVPAFVSFDHDLGPGPDGMACAHYLVNRCQDLGAPLPGWRVHSKNGPGAANIEGLMASFARFQAAQATPPRSPQR